MNCFEYVAMKELTLDPPEVPRPFSRISEGLKITAGVTYQSA